MAKASLLTLPVELRLDIYDVLGQLRQSPMFCRPVSHERFSYLYRTPGRMSKPGPATYGHHIVLLSICHQIRDEMLDILFRRRQFYLEASLYASGFYGGSLPMPNDAFPSMWLHTIRRLVLFTVFDNTNPRRIADLRPLQKMTGLMELWLVCSIRPQDRTTWPNSPYSHPIRAVLESIPTNCAVRIGCTASEQDLFIQDIGFGLDYLFGKRNEALYEDLARLLPLWTARKGHLSGDTTDHSICTVGVCEGGRDCVNSARHGLPELSPSRRRKLFWSR